LCRCQLFVPFDKIQDPGFNLISVASAGFILLVASGNSTAGISGTLDTIVVKIIGSIKFVNANIIGKILITFGVIHNLKGIRIIFILHRRPTSDGLDRSRQVERSGSYRDNN
jgi:hypothetical protein